MSLSLTVGFWCESQSRSQPLLSQSFVQTRFWQPECRAERQCAGHDVKNASTHDAENPSDLGWDVDTFHSVVPGFILVGKDSGYPAEAAPVIGTF